MSIVSCGIHRFLSCKKFISQTVTSFHVLNPNSFLLQYNSRIVLLWSHLELNLMANICKVFFYLPNVSQWCDILLPHIDATICIPSNLSDFLQWCPDRCEIFEIMPIHQLSLWTLVYRRSSVFLPRIFGRLLIQHFIQAARQNICLIIRFRGQRYRTG